MLTVYLRQSRRPVSVWFQIRLSDLFHCYQPVNDNMNHYQQVSSFIILHTTTLRRGNAPGGGRQLLFYYYDDYYYYHKVSVWQQESAGQPKAVCHLRIPHRKSADWHHHISPSGRGTKACLSGATDQQIRRWRMTGRDLKNEARAETYSKRTRGAFKMHVWVAAAVGAGAGACLCNLIWIFVLLGRMTQIPQGLIQL